MPHSNHAGPKKERKPEYKTAVAMCHLSVTCKLKIKTHQWLHFAMISMIQVFSHKWVVPLQYIGFWPTYDGIQ